MQSNTGNPEVDATKSKGTEVDATKSRGTTTTGGKTWAPGQSDFDKAADVDRETAAGYRDGRWLSVWATRGKDLSMYGSGIHLSFGFGLGFARIVWFCAVLSVAYLAFNVSGDNMANGSHVPAAFEGTQNEYISWTAVSNMGKGAERLVTFIDPFDWGPYAASEVGYGVGIVDAFCILLVFVVALWYELKIIPSASEDHRYTEAFSVFVDKLPRRLPGEQHRRYAELLHAHFEHMLRGELNPEDLSTIAVGSKVMAKGDEGIADFKRERWCGLRVCPQRYSARDEKGRLLGKVVKAKDGQLQVQWRPEKGDDGRYPKPERKELKAEELLDHPMCKRIEHQAQHEGYRLDDHMVHEVTLVRDFGGRLGALRAGAEARHAERSEVEAMWQVEAQVEEARKRQEKLDEEDNERAQKAEEAHSELQTALQTQDKKKLKSLKTNLDLPLVDRDVVGAYVVFSRVQNRDFVFDEYRFSRTYLRLLQNRYLRFGGCRIRVDEATDPSEIFWEHMDTGKVSRFFRVAVVALINVILVSFSIAFFASAKHIANEAKSGTTMCDATQVFVDQCLADTDCECANAGLANVLNNVPAGVKACCDDWLNSQYQAHSATLGASIAPVILNVVIGYVINFLANFTKSNSITSTNQAILLMTTVMQLVNIVVSVIVVNADFGSAWRGWIDDAFGSAGFGSDNFPIGCGAYATLTPEWYAEVGATIAFSLGVSAITIPMAMPVSYFIHVAFKKVFAKRVKSSEQLRALFVRPTYNLALVAAQDAVMIIACLAFAGGMPVLWPTLAVYLSLSFLAKKYTFLRGSKEPPHFSNHLSRMTVRWVQVAAVLHCAIAVWVFGTPESLPSERENYGLDLSMVEGWLDRLDYKNTHAAFVVLVLILALVVLRLVAFILGRVGTALVVATARLFLSAAHGHGQSGCPCLTRCAQTGVGSCLARTWASLRRGGHWVSTCIADFDQKAVDDGVMRDRFADGPCEHFKKHRIPWSYQLENNLEYKKVVEQDAGRKSPKDEEAPAAHEAPTAQEPPRPQVEAL